MRLKNIVEILGFICLAVAAYLVSLTLGLACTGLALVILGNLPDRKREEKSE